MAVLKSEETSVRRPQSEPSLSEQSASRLYEDSYDDFRHGCGVHKHSTHRRPDDDENDRENDRENEPESERDSMGEGERNGDREHKNERDREREGGRERDRENDLELSEENQKMHKMLEEKCDEALNFAVDPVGTLLSREWRGFTNTPGNYLLSESTMGLSQLFFPVDYK